MVDNSPAKDPPLGWTWTSDRNENSTWCRQSCPLAALDSLSSEPGWARTAPSCRSWGRRSPSSGSVSPYFSSSAAAPSA